MLEPCSQISRVSIILHIKPIINTLRFFESTKRFVFPFILLLNFCWNKPQHSLKETVCVGLNFFFTSPTQQRCLILIFSSGITTGCDLLGVFPLNTTRRPTSVWRLQREIWKQTNSFPCGFCWQEFFILTSYRCVSASPVEQWTTARWQLVV